MIERHRYLSTIEQYQKKQLDERHRNSCESPKDITMEKASRNIPDYPAAHSMDTAWFAVDENGELGILTTDAEGDVPVLDVMASDDLINGTDRIPNEFMNQNYYFDIYHELLEACRGHLGLGPTDSFEHYDVRRKALYQFSPEWRGWYLWMQSPENPMTLNDLPAKYHSSRYLMHLKDYVFSSRDPINPFDYFINCFSYDGNSYMVSPEGTCFPVNALQRKHWADRDFEQAEFRSDGAYYFIVDAKGHLGLFRSGGLGLIPQNPESHHLVYDWSKMIQVFEAAGIKRDESNPAPCHWLEYPFQKCFPRLLGLYHYDMSWLHAIPSIQIASPRNPLKLTSLPDTLIETIKPVKIPAVDFGRDRLIQPAEWASFIPYQHRFLGEMPYKQSEFWVDSKLSAVHLFGPDCHNLDTDERLLRRARNYIKIVEEMAREE